jgi:uncharacterized protein (DUF2252 family)
MTPGAKVDLPRLIQQHNAGRDPERLALKYRAMRGSAFAFLRGSCALFYAQLPSAGVFRSAPSVWVCGDLHLENFGSYKADNRLVYFDLNDFDEAALAPASWELVRYLTSLRLAAAALGADCESSNALCTTFINAYAAALMAGKAYWVERETAQGPAGALLESLRQRSRKAFLDSRTRVRAGRRTMRIDGHKALPASAAQRDLVGNFMAQFAKSQERPDFFAVRDVARRIAGTGSLGLDRYAILVEGKGSPDGNYLLDLKASQASALAPRLSLVQPRWTTQAQRIVTVQRRMQAVSMAFLQPVLMDEQPYVLRALQPSEDRIAMARPELDSGALAQTVALQGRLLAWAQLRSSGREGSATADELIAWGNRRKWQQKLHDLAKACATQCQRDAATFATAFDDGAFGD